MKRIKIAPGKFVTVSSELAEKAARVFASGAFTSTKVEEMAALEPKRATLLIGGRGKPQTKSRRVVSGAIKVKASSPRSSAIVNSVKRKAA